MISLLLTGLGLKTKLLMRRGPVIAFDLPSMGELQFVGPVLIRFCERNPTANVLVVHNGDTIAAFKRIAPSISERALHVQRTVLNAMVFQKIKLFFTSEQYNLGLQGVYSIAICHGHAAKGLSFVPEIVKTFDAFFLIGPIHREAFEVFISEFMDNKSPDYIELFNVGYPKSDYLLNGRYDADKISTDLSLDRTKKTVLYAPAFNEGASLREHGVEIITLLAQQSQYNVLVKLPIDCCGPTSNLYATGGVNWFEIISEIQSGSPNLRLYYDYQIDPLLACSDVLITCISSVGFEFLALNRPVIFIDTPAYFSGWLKRTFPDKDTVAWSQRTTVNGGKEFGLVVNNFMELPEAIETVLAYPDEYPRQQERLKSYLLYNRGRGTEAAVSKIEELLAKRVKSSRTKIRFYFFWNLLVKLKHAILVLVKENSLKFLNSLGYSIQATGSGYIDAEETIREARKTHLSVCEYLESRETDQRKHGRRDRIIEAMIQRGLIEKYDAVLEIGAGTGMYLENVLEFAQPKRYEVYETNAGWVRYLREAFGSRSNCYFIFQPTDGTTLKETATASCDLVHAHAVFVYIPLLQVLGYIKEAARVCRPGGHVVFDCLLDCSFDRHDAEAWLAGPWRFPVLIPESLLLDFAGSYGLELTDRFQEIYGSSFSDYLIFRKR